MRTWGATSSTPLGLWGDEDGGERRRRPPRPDRLAGGEGGRATLNRPLPNGSGEKKMRKSERSKESMFPLRACSFLSSKSVNEF